MVNTLNLVLCPSEACTQLLNAIPAHKYLLLYGIKVSVEPDDYSHPLSLCNVLWFFPALRASRSKSPHLGKKSFAQIVMPLPVWSSNHRSTYPGKRLKKLVVCSFALTFLCCGASTSDSQMVWCLWLLTLALKYMDVFEDCFLGVEELSIWILVVIQGLPSLPPLAF